MNPTEDFIEPERPEVLDRLRAVGPERATIALALKDKDAAYAVVEELDSFDYQTDQFRSLFQIIKLLVDRKVDPTVSAVIDSADEYVISKLKESGGREYLDRLMNFSDSARNIFHWINLIKEKSKLRDTIITLGDIYHAVVSQADEPGVNPSELMTAIETDIDSLGLRVSGISSGIVQISASKDGSTDDFDEFHEEARKQVEEGNGSGLETGFANFDGFIHGFQPGRVYVLAAKFKGGKSLAMTEFAKRIGVGREIRSGYNRSTSSSNEVLDLSGPIEMMIDLSREDEKFHVMNLTENPRRGMIVDTEMELKRDVKPRLIASVAGVPQYLMRDGKWILEEEYHERVRIANRLIYDSDIYFANCSNIHDFDTIKAVIRTGIHKHGAEWIVFDYIRNPWQSNEDEYTFLGRLTYFLRSQAEKYNIPIIAGAQLGRSATKQARARDGSGGVSGSQIQGSVKILQACDMLITLEDYDDGTENQKMRVDISRYSQANSDNDWFHMEVNRDLARFNIDRIVSADEFAA